ncbi:GNAT family N-acetyltransferase [Terrimonas pollutisoli]|uniref:GNAT family N-acetyltransferase n=1 Tax=Terrimonas pollutisoli TaxID=3034147 RepID=UPI0034DF5DA1
MYYLWFIGVDPAFQGKGTGSQLMREIIADSKSASRVLCLETSTVKNIPWYQQFGFVIYNELNFGYTLFFLKREDRA